MLTDKTVNKSPTKDTREAWNRRAGLSGLRPEGVLFKRFPEALNRVIHEFHSKIISDGLSGLNEDCSILDVGCGYGRISVEIRKRFLHQKIFGIDGSWNFIRDYAGFVGGKTTGLRGDAVDLPFHSGCFDAVIAVTCLMYIPYGLRSKCMEEIFRVTKDGGIIILIEPGISAQRIYSCFRIPNLIKKSGIFKDHNTGGKGFTTEEIQRYLRSNGGIILKKYGNPGFSLMLPPLFLSLRLSLNGMYNMFFRFSIFLDQIVHIKPDLSLHMGFVVRKPTA